MRMVVRAWGFELAGEVGGPPGLAQKNILHKIISVLRSDNSSVNAASLAADRTLRLQNDVPGNSCASVCRVGARVTLLW